MTSCNALVYEAILRVYRNAVVGLIRSGMGAAYPDDYKNRVTSRFNSCDANGVLSAADVLEIPYPLGLESLCAEVCVIYDLKTVPVPRSRTCEWYRMRDGKIASVSVVFDPRPFAAMFEGHQGQ